MYRDELEQAKKRIDELGEQLEAQRTELEALRTQVRKRSPDQAARQPSQAHVILAAGAVVAAAAAGWALLGTASSEPVIGPASASASAVVTVPAPTIDPPPRHGRGGRYPRVQQGDPGVGVEMPPRTTLERLAARCRRSVDRASFAELPQGTRVLDFRACSGCECCLEGGLFPAHERPTPGEPEPEDCRACSKAAALTSLGITVIGSTEYDQLRGGSGGLTMRMTRPARLVGLRLQGSGHMVTSEPREPYVIRVLARDPAGRPVDGLAVEVPSAMERVTDVPDEVRRPFVVVEACPGETIGQLDLHSTANGVGASEVAVLLAD